MSDGKVTATIEFKLTRPQATILSSKKRFKVINAGRRFGKSWLSGAAIMDQAVNHPGSVIWYVAPTLGMAKKIMWNTWLLEHIPESYIQEKNKQDMIIRFINGSILYVLSADIPDNLRGPSVDLLIMDECSSMKESAYEVIRPTLSDKYCEGKAIFVSTPDGYNWFYHLYQKGLENPEEYDCFQYTTIEGGNVADEEIESARRDMSPKMFAQEYLASFETLSNRVYENFSRIDNVCDDEEDWWGRSGDIHVGIDFNVNPMTAAIAVKIGKTYIFFDEIVEPNASTQVLCDRIKRKYPNVHKYAYPDPTGKKRQTSASVGTTDFEILRRNGFTVCAPHAPYSSRDKFNAVNTAFLNAKGEKHVFIARNRCPKLKEAFAGYCYKESGDDTDKSTGLDHISDAAAYLICYNLPIKKSYGLNRPRVYGY